MKNRVVLLILIIFSVLLFFIGLGMGSLRIPAADIPGALLGTGEENVLVVVRQVRAPRVFAAFILGGALALSGYLMQTFFHNPIAGPYVLGVASGARLFVALTMIMGSVYAFHISSLMLIVVAFSGALLSMGLVLILSKRVYSMSLLIVAGVMIGYICSAVTDLVVTFADDHDIVSLHSWSRGSFSGMSWSMASFFSPAVLICLICSFFLAKPMAAYILGESYAHSVGVNVSRLRGGMILLSCMAAGIVTAFAGPVSFVGIAVPQISARLIRDVSPIWQIPSCFLCGGIFCMLCDMIARSLLAPAELSISTVTAVFGAPLVLYILVKRQSRTG